MLENIKSDYFIIKIFSYLEALSKLRIIKYNKALQNKIHINFTDYERNSKTYIIFKENNTVEEYDSVNDELIFEGEYLNGKKWNGKGYDEGKIIYELKDGKGFFQDYVRINSYRGLILQGEYINGEANGKIKEYNINEKLIFEGEYLNGKRHGKGTEFYNKEILKFEGEYLNDKKWEGKGYDINGNIIYELKNGIGYIKEYDIDGKLNFEGEYLNGERNGKGKEYDNNGKVTFEGEYLEGKKKWKRKRI